MSGSEDSSLVGKVYENGILRFGIFPEKRSSFIDAPHLEPLSGQTIQSRWTEEGLLLCQAEGFRFLYDPALALFKLSIKRKELLNGSLQTGQFAPALFSVELKEGEDIYGFGAASGKINRNDQEFELLNRDTFLYSIPQSSYSSFPFFIFPRGAIFVGVFWNSILPARVKTLSLPGEHEKRGVYIRPLLKHIVLPQDFFVLSGDLREIIQQLFELTGRSFFPPLWALGYHQSRWSYRTSDEVLEIAKKFRELSLPCDAIHLDIHYMDQYRIFTWHPKRFPRPKAMHKELKAMGFRSVAIVDPCVSVDEKFHVYREGAEKGYFCKNSQGELYKGQVWPGRSVFPDFSQKETRSWWSGLHQSLFDMGVSGIWNDMNEPTLKIKRKRHPLKEDMGHSSGSHWELRNFYANLEAEATYAAFSKYSQKDPRSLLGPSASKALRPWVLTRSAFSGIQKYAALWTGDNSTSWKSLRENLYMALNLSLSGVGHCGADVGGFASSLESLPIALRVIKLWKKKKLLARWFELASLMPFFRMHTALLSYRQEPWSFGRSCLRVCKKHMRRRYQLLPYLYTLSWEMYEKGSLWLRPLSYEFPGLEMQAEREEFLIGPALLSAPVLYPNLKVREVYLPPGIWYEYESGTLYEGDMLHNFKTPLGYYPLFVRGGSVLPLAPPLHNAKSSVDRSLFLEIYPDKEIFGLVYQDDGESMAYTEGNYNLLECMGQMNSARSLSIQIKFIHRKYSSPFQRFEIRLPKKYRYMEDGGRRIEAKFHDLREEGRNYIVSSFQLPYASGRYTFRSG